MFIYSTISVCVWSYKVFIFFTFLKFFILVSFNVFTHSSGDKAAAVRLQILLKPSCSLHIFLTCHQYLSLIYILICIVFFFYLFNFFFSNFFVLYILYTCKNTSCCTVCKIIFLGQCYLELYQGKHCCADGDAGFCTAASFCGFATEMLCKWKPGGKSLGSSDKTLRTASPKSFPLSCSSFESNKRLTNDYKLCVLCASKPSLLNPNKYACLWSSSDLPSAVSDVKLINSFILHSTRANDPF